MAGPRLIAPHAATKRYSLPCLRELVAGFTPVDEHVVILVPEYPDRVDPDDDVPGLRLLRGVLERQPNGKPPRPVARGESEDLERLQPLAGRTLVVDHPDGRA